MLATKAAICGQLFFLCIGFIAANEWKNSLHQGQKGERDSSHLLCLLWRILCGRRDNSTAVGFKRIEVKCESKLCSFFHSFLDQKNSTLFYNNVPNSSVIKDTSKLDNFSNRERHITDFSSENIVTKVVNNSSVSKKMKFNQNGVQRYPESLAYYVNSQFTSRTLKEHFSDNPLRKATSFLNPSENDAEHLISSVSNFNLEPIENDTNFQFSTSEIYNFNESVISSSLPKDKFSKELLNHEEKKMGVISKAVSVNESAIFERAFNAQTNFTDTKPINRMDSLTSKNDDGTTKSNLLIRSSETNFARFPKASYESTSDAKSNTTELSENNVDDFQHKFPRKSSNNSLLNKIAFQREKIFGSVAEINGDTFELTTKLNEGGIVDKNASKFESHHQTSLENSNYSNDSEIYSINKRELAITSKENSYETVSNDMNSTLITNQTLENSISTEFKNDESLSKLENHKNISNELYFSNFSFNKPEKKIILSNNGNLFPFNLDKSEANSRVNNSQILNKSGTQPEHILNIDDHKTTGNYSKISISVEQPLSAETRGFDSGVSKPNIFKYSVKNLLSNTTLTTALDIPYSKQPSPIQPNTLKHLFPTVATTFTQDSNEENLTQNLKFLSIESHEMDSNTETIYAAKNEFSGSSTQTMHGINNYKNKVVPQKTDELLVTNRNQNFTSDYRDFDIHSIYTDDEESMKDKNEELETESNDEMLDINEIFSSDHPKIDTSTDISKSNHSEEYHNNERKLITISTKVELPIDDDDKEKKSRSDSSTSFNDVEFPISSSNPTPADFKENKDESSASNLHTHAIKTTGSTKMALNLSSAGNEAESNRYNFQTPETVKEAKLEDGLSRENDAQTNAAQEYLIKAIITSTSISPFRNKTESRIIPSKMANTTETFNEKNLNMNKTDVNYHVQMNKDGLEEVLVDSSTFVSMADGKTTTNTAIFKDNLQTQTSYSSKEMHHNFTESEVQYETENTTINLLLNLSSTVKVSNITPEKVKTKIVNTTDEFFTDANDSKMIIQHPSTFSSIVLQKDTKEPSETTSKPQVKTEETNFYENSEEPSKITVWLQSTAETDYTADEFKEFVQSTAIPQRTVQTSYITETLMKSSERSQSTSETYFVTKDSEETSKTTEHALSRSESNHDINSKTTSENESVDEFITSYDKLHHKSMSSTVSTDHPKEYSKGSVETTKPTVKINGLTDYSKEQTKLTLMPKPTVEANYPLKEIETLKTVLTPQATTKMHYVTEEFKILSSAETTEENFLNDAENNEDNISDFSPLTLIHEIQTEISESPWKNGTFEENSISRSDTTEPIIPFSLEWKKYNYLPDTTNPMFLPTNLPRNTYKDLLPLSKTRVTRTESTTHRQGVTEIYSITEAGVRAINDNIVTSTSSDLLTKKLISNQDKTRHVNGPILSDRTVANESIKPIIHLDPNGVVVQSDRTTTSSYFPTKFTTQKWDKWGRSDFAVSTEKIHDDVFGKVTIPFSSKDIIHTHNKFTTENVRGSNFEINGYKTPATVPLGLSKDDLINHKINPILETKEDNGFLNPTTQSSDLFHLINEVFESHTMSGMVTTKEEENKNVPHVTNDASLTRTERDTERTLDNDYFSNNADSDSDVIRTERDLSSFEDGNFEINQGFGTIQPEKSTSPLEKKQTEVTKGFPTETHTYLFGEGQLGVNQKSDAPLPHSNVSPFDENQFGMKQGFGTPEIDDKVNNFGNIDATGDVNFNVNSGVDLNSDKGHSKPDSENNPNIDLSVNFGFETKDSENNNLDKDITTPSHDIMPFSNGNVLLSTVAPNLNQNLDVPGGKQTMPSSVGGYTMPSSVREQTMHSSVGEQTIPSSVGGQTIPSSVGGQTITSSVGGQTMPSSVGGQTMPSSGGRETMPSSGQQTMPSSVGQQTMPSSVGQQTMPSSVGMWTRPSSLEQTKPSSVYGTTNEGYVSHNPTIEFQSSSTASQESTYSSQSTVASTESSIIPFHFTIDADYEKVVGSKKEKFEENLSKQLAVAMRVPMDCVQNLQVKKGSIEVNFDLVPNSDHGHLADEKALQAAADELKRMIDNGQLTINDLDGNTLVVVPLDPPTNPPPASNMEHTTLILGVVIGAFILTVITVAIAAIVYKRKSSGDHRLSPIEEARRNLPSYRDIPFQEALFMKGSGHHKVMLGKYCYNTGQWLGPGPEPKLFQAPESVVYRPPTDSEIRRTPRPPTAVRERLKYDWEVDWDSMVYSR